MALLTPYYYEGKVTVVPDLCLSFKIHPHTLNALSDGALDAGMLKIKRANFERPGKRSLNFHH